MTITERLARRQVRAAEHTTAAPGARAARRDDPRTGPIPGAGDRAGFWRGKFRAVFPGVFLVYLVQTGAGAVDHANGVWTALGLGLLAAFCLCYLGAVLDGTAGRYQRFWLFYTAMVGLFVLELPIARQDALPMLTYIAVLTIAARYARALPVVALLTVIPLVLPPLVRPWHAGPQIGTAISVGIVSLAMYSFFGVIRANEALHEARAEVARLAAEGERTRIARDLHDLLGHSLTTITVKAGLASRLSERDPARAAREIAEVEELARRTLTDVRAAVTGYRDLTLANELANAQEVLRAAGISGRIPKAVEEIPLAQSELFAWVVREGVTNVVRHSRAASCEITLSPSYVQITDDGRGCTDDLDGARSGNGLAGLRERVLDAGGLLTVGAGAGGRGFRLRVELAR